MKPHTLWPWLAASLLAGCSNSPIAAPQDGAVPDLSVSDQASPPTDLAMACSALSGLVAYFPFEGDTRDHSGNGNDATGTSVSYMTGKLGQGATLGAGSSLQVSGATQLAGARTFCAWINLTSTGGYGAPVFVGGTAGAGDFFGVTTPSPSPASTCMQLKGTYMYQDHWGAACDVTPSVMLATNQWQFACWGWDGATARSFYGNGTLQQGSGAAFSYALSTVTIASNTISGTTTQPTFAGTIDEVSVWSRALTQSEMDLLYNSGDGCAPK